MGAGSHGGLCRTQRDHAAVLAGHAGEELLASYEPERRTADGRNVQRSMENGLNHLAVAAALGIEPSQTGRVKWGKGTVLLSPFPLVQSELEGLLEPDRKEEFQGRADVRQVFNVSRIGKVAGCYVTSGVAAKNAKIRVVRNNIVIRDNVGIESLKHFKDDALVMDQWFGVQAGCPLPEWRSAPVASQLRSLQERLAVGEAADVLHGNAGNVIQRLAGQERLVRHDVALPRQGPRLRVVDAVLGSPVRRRIRVVG